jgi:hypothetical protein
MVYRNHDGRIAWLACRNQHMEYFRLILGDALLLLLSILPLSQVHEFFPWPDQFVVRRYNKQLPVELDQKIRHNKHKELVCILAVCVAFSFKRFHQMFAVDKRPAAIAGGKCR